MFILCIYCEEKHHKINDTKLLKEKQHEFDSEVRRLICKKCGAQHMFTIN